MNTAIKNIEKFFTISTAAFSFSNQVLNTVGSKIPAKSIQMEALHRAALLITQMEIPDDEKLKKLNGLLIEMENLAGT